MNIVELAAAGPIENPELRKYTERPSSVEYSRHYVAFKNGEEVGFITLDFLPVEEHLVIYQLFVHSGAARQGYGTELLKHIESMAKAWGYAQIKLHARPTENRLTKAQLIAWYEKRGYVWQHDSGDTMLKAI